MILVISAWRVLGWNQLSVLLNVLCCNYLAFQVFPPSHIGPELGMCVMNAQQLGEVNFL